MMPSSRFILYVVTSWLVLGGAFLSPAMAQTPAEIQGTVITGEGLPVEGAAVSLLALPGGDEVARAVTDARGRFALPGTESPAQLLITHPRFQAQVVPLTGEAGAQAAGARFELTLAAKQEVYERIVVSGSRGGDRFAPETISSTVIEPEEVVDTPSTLLDVVDTVPGVAENGQAGLFQVFSIRGVSRHRVLTLISGMQITSERRAGVSTSFLDPTLLGSVDLLRGPASSYYGSGALGGVVQVFPESFEELSVTTGYETAGSETWQSVGWGRPGADGYSVAIAHRRANNASTPDGSELNSHFQQVSATLRKSWDGGEGRRYELLAIPTWGDDLGKSNTDFPERTTNYPTERHLLTRFTVEDDTWRAFAWLHPHELETDTRRFDAGGRETRQDLVLNETLDFGANARKELTWGEWAGRLGVDYFARRGVDALEIERRLGGIETGTRTLDGAQQDEAAAYGSARRQIGRVSLEAGGRFTWMRQSNADEDSLDHSAWNGFAGAVMPLGGGFELAANVGTGIRFPTLSERFFTGTTGRGEILSNQNLDPERSINADIRLRWFGQRLFVEVDAFRNEIDDYIERIEIEPDVLTFVNLLSGRLVGLETEGFYDLTGPWRVLWGGHVIDGEDDGGGALADVPPGRFFVGYRKAATGDAGRWGRFELGGRLEWRDSLDDPGPGEQAIPSATLLTASVGYQLRPDLALTVSGSNLLNEEYFSSADDKTPLSPERSVGFALEWRR